MEEVFQADQSAWEARVRRMQMKIDRQRCPSCGPWCYRDSCACARAEFFDGQDKKRKNHNDFLEKQKRIAEHGKCDLCPKCPRIDTKYGVLCWDCFCEKEGFLPEK